jgi:hypothetical protein
MKVETLSEVTCPWCGLATGAAPACGPDGCTVPVRG